LEDIKRRIREIHPDIMLIPGEASEAVIGGIVVALVDAERRLGTGNAGRGGLGLRLDLEAEGCRPRLDPGDMLRCRGPRPWACRRDVQRVGGPTGTQSPGSAAAIACSQCRSRPAIRVAGACGRCRMTQHRGRGCTVRSPGPGWAYTPRPGRPRPRRKPTSRPWRRRPDAECQFARGEAAGHHRVHGADARSGEHSDYPSGSSAGG
jgi:hypothetical protein